MRHNMAGDISLSHTMPDFKVITPLWQLPENGKCHRIDDKVCRKKDTGSIMSNTQPEHRNHATNEYNSLILVISSAY